MPWNFFQLQTRWKESYIQYCKWFEQKNVIKYFVPRIEPKKSRYFCKSFSSMILFFHRFTTNSTCMKNAWNKNHFEYQMHPFERIVSHDQPEFWCTNPNWIWKSYFCWQLWQGQHKAWEINFGVACHSSESTSNLSSHVCDVISFDFYRHFLIGWTRKWNFCYCNLSWSKFKNIISPK